MSNWYRHERDEVRLDRYEQPRPNMPMPSNHWTGMREYLLGRNLSFPTAKKNGWYPSDQIDGFNRIVIPCSNTDNVPYYQARAIDEWAMPRYHSPKATRKDSVVIVFPNSEIERVGSVVVEGPMDALAAAPYGFVAFGLMGNSPPDNVIELIVRHIKGCYEPTLIIPDLDHLEMGSYMAGTLGTHGIPTRVVLPQKKDLCEMKLSARKELLMKGLNDVQLVQKTHRGRVGR